MNTEQTPQAETGRPQNSSPPATTEPVIRVSEEDQLLIAAILDGDEEAFVTLVKRHHNSLLRQAMALLRERAAAEDMVQETWVAVLEGLHRFEGRAALKTWITRILLNRIKTRFQKERRYVAFAEPADKDEPAVDPDRFDSRGHWKGAVSRWSKDSPERLAVSSELGTLIEQSLETLPDAQRTVVVLRDVEGWSSREVCEALGTSEANQRVLLHRGRSRLRKILDSYRRTGIRPETKS